MWYTKEKALTFVLNSLLLYNCCLLPLCWKAFSKNTTPHQQHWANSVQKSPSNHLLVIGWIDVICQYYGLHLAAPLQLCEVLVWGGRNSKVLSLCTDTAVGGFMPVHRKRMTHSCYAVSLSWRRPEQHGRNVGKIFVSTLVLEKHYILHVSASWEPPLQTMDMCNALKYVHQTIYIVSAMILPVNVSCMVILCNCPLTTHAWPHHV